MEEHERGIAFDSIAKNMVPYLSPTCFMFYKHYVKGNRDIATGPKALQQSILKRKEIRCKLLQSIILLLYYKIVQKSHTRRGRFISLIKDMDLT